MKGVGIGVSVPRLQPPSPPLRLWDPCIPAQKRRPQHLLNPPWGAELSWRGQEGWGWRPQRVRPPCGPRATRPVAPGAGSASLARTGRGWSAAGSLSPRALRLFSRPLRIPGPRLAGRPRARPALARTPVAHVGTESSRGCWTPPLPAGPYGLSDGWPGPSRAQLSPRAVRATPGRVGLVPPKRGRTRGLGENWAGSPWACAEPRLHPLLVCDQKQRAPLAWPWLLLRGPLLRAPGERRPPGWRRRSGPQTSGRVVVLGTPTWRASVCADHLRARPSDILSPQVFEGPSADPRGQLVPNAFPHGSWV